MQPPLTDVEVRILGSLVEKQATTPDSYPLSLSALTAACSQTSNREPVMRLDEATVDQAATALRRRSLLRTIQPIGSRVMKYEHLLEEVLDLDARERAVLGVLMLRGAQTAGELHARTARLATFADIAQLEATLEALIAREQGALVVRLPRRPGQREVRYAHLLSGDAAAVTAADAAEAPRAAAPSPAPARAEADDERVAALERTMEELRAELGALRAEFVAFREQFG